MKLRIALIVLLAVGAPASCFAQFTPSKAQHEKLAKQKKKIMLLELKIARLQADELFEIANLERECRAVVLDNRWPNGTMCNAQNLIFVSAGPSAPSSPSEPERKGPPPRSPDADKP